MKIFLIGMPGSGKSTLGKGLADKLAYPLLDLDVSIEENAGMTITDIFQYYGEDYFRELEMNALRNDTLKHEHFVMATGGGAPCFHGNMDWMNDHGITIFLKVPIETIANRLIGDEIRERPLLHDISRDDFVQEFNAKFEKRMNIYKQAKLILNEDQLEPDRVVELLLKS